MKSRATMVLIASLVLGPPLRWTREFATVQANSPLGLGWSIVTMPGPSLTQGGPSGPEGGPPMTVVRAGLGLMALGPEPVGPPLLWRSTDGRSWQYVSSNRRVFQPSDEITGLVQGQRGIVAVGVHHRARAPGGPPMPRLTAAAWSSSDGRRWRRATGPADTFKGARMFAVQARGPGFVGVGETDTVTTRGNATYYASNAAVWTSQDGMMWHRVLDTGPTFRQATMLFLVSAGRGLIAVGQSRIPFAPRHTVIWTSPDGRAWTRIAWNKSVFPPNTEISQVVTGAGGLVALGTQSTGQIPQQVLWTSRTGADWTRLSRHPFRSGFAVHIEPYAGGWLAVGQYDDEPTLWSSPDGVRWTRVAGEDAFGGGATRINDVLDWRGGLVAVGLYDQPTYETWSVVPPSHARAVAWLSTPGRGRRAPSWAWSDPKWFRLRLADLPAGFHPFGGSGGGSYGIGCTLDEAPPGFRVPAVCRKAVGPLGPSIAYTSRLPYGPDVGLNAPYVGQYTILAQHEAGARAAFRSAGGLLIAIDLNENTRSPRLMPGRPRIGQGARVYREQTGGRGTAYGAVWREGRAIGVVEVVGVPGDRAKLAVTLATKQWQHWHQLMRPHATGSLWLSRARAAQGGTWHAVRIPVSVPSDITCPDPHVCDVIGYGSRAGHPRTLVIQTHDAGTTWTKRGEVSSLVHRLVCPSTSDCYGVGSVMDGVPGTSTTIVRTIITASSDGGQTWRPVFRSNTRGPLSTICRADGTRCPQITDIACPASTTCYATGYFFVSPLRHGARTRYAPFMVTVDGGQTWRQLSVPLLQADAIVCPSTSLCYVTGFDGGRVVLAVTADAGVTWHHESSRKAIHLDHLSCPSAVVCFGSGSDGGNGLLAWTRNGGKSWRVHMTTRDEPADIACPSPSDCYAAGPLGQHEEQAILATHDGGTSWQQEWYRRPRTSSPYFLTAVGCPATSVCYVTVNPGYVLLRRASRSGVRDLAPHAMVELTQGGAAVIRRIRWPASMSQTHPPTGARGSAAPRRSDTAGAPARTNHPPRVGRRGGEGANWTQVEIANSCAPAAAPWAPSAPLPPS